MGIFTLPEGYKEIYCLDLQKNKKMAIIMNLGALAIFGGLFFLGGQFVPFRLEISGDSIASLLFYFVKLAGVFLSVMLYMVGHELVHGFFIKRFSGKKAHYGFTGLYAFAGSEAWFPKMQYIVIALAPVVFFGVVFLLLNLLLPVEWFWWIYFLQMTNISGAIGDFYVTILMGKFPQDVLVKDFGVSMKMYSKSSVS